MSVGLNVQTPWTNARMHCRIRSLVDYISEGKLIFLTFQ